MPTRAIFGHRKMRSDKELNSFIPSTFTKRGTQLGKCTVQFNFVYTFVWFKPTTQAPEVYSYLYQYYVEMRYKKCVALEIYFEKK